MTPLHSIPKRLVRRAGLALVVPALLLGLGAAPALAAPELNLSLESDSGSPSSEFPVVHHSDERIDYTVKVKDAAAKTESVAAGTVLTCQGGKWTEEGASGFGLSYQWLSNGSPAGGPGAHTAAYEVQAADEGHALQCVVTAHDNGGAAITASLPLGPSSAPTYAGAFPSGALTPQDSRPTIAKTGESGTEKMYACTPPAAGVWTGSPTWTYQWWRNNTPIPGATGSTYAAHTGAGEEDHVVALQCEVIGANGGGAIAAFSNAGGFTGTVSQFIAEHGAFPPINRGFAGAFPLVVDPNGTFGKVTVELELPGGEETFAFKTEPDSWKCEEHPASPATGPATAVCSREDTLPPGEEFPALKVVTALGADAPDIATARATVFGGGAAPASEELSFPIAPALPFGVSKFTAPLLDPLGHDYIQAGGHPLKGESELVFNGKRALIEPTFFPFVPVAQTRQVIAELPPGVVGNALALPELCSGVEAVREEECPLDSVVGGILLFTSEVEVVPEPIYAIEPEFGAPAQFAFKDPLKRTYTFSPRLRAGDGYAVSLELAPAPSDADVLESTVTLCDFGGATTGSGATFDLQFAGCKEGGAPDANPEPLITTPTRCGVPLTTRLRLNSWSDPTFVEAPPFSNAPMEGCQEVPFEPETELQPTSHQADSPTGLDVEVSMPTQGLEEPEGISQSDLREAKVTFPEGMAINPSAGQGLGACSKEQIKLGTNDPISCPESSKIGSVEIETPVLEDTLKGSVYIAKQGDVESSPIGFYLVFDSPKNGILVKLPAKVTPDPQTGQLTVTVAESPQQPFSAVRMHFPGGPHATLLTPPKCGTYQIKSELVPWSGGAPVTQSSSFTVDQGPGGGACPTGALDAGFSAGSANPLAGQTSPFNVRLTRPDGSDRFTALGLHLPPGLTAYLKGVPYCPQSAIAQAISREGEGQGQVEIDHPSCPAASQIGTVTAGAGAGDNPLYVDTGRAYLAGPYKGAPLSIVVIAPAVAGPLDLGNVVVRNALHLDPRTAEVNVVSDPIPTIQHGVLLDIRDVRVQIDRPGFTLNPTDCEPMSVGASVSGQGGLVANLDRHFQVGGCGALGFKPKLYTRLFGPTHRGAFPRFRAVYKPRPGDANLKDLVLRFPRSEFIEQGHFRSICTRVQYAADGGLGGGCPESSVYGHITAVTPLLDEPLQGPIFLRSSNHNLPDVVFALHGQVDAETAVKIDSHKGGLRATIEDAPDVPLTKVVVNMQGRQKGLFVNSRNICARSFRAAVSASAHNGRISTQRPALRDAKCGKRRTSRHRH